MPKFRLDRSAFFPRGRRLEGRWAGKSAKICPIRKSVISRRTISTEPKPIVRRLEYLHENNPRSEDVDKSGLESSTIGLKLHAQLIEHRESRMECCHSKQVHSSAHPIQALSAVLPCVSYILLTYQLSTMTCTHQRDLKSIAQLFRRDVM